MQAIRIRGALYALDTWRRLAPADSFRPNVARFTFTSPNKREMLHCCVSSRHLSPVRSDEFHHRAIGRPRGCGRCNVYDGGVILRRPRPTKLVTRWPQILGFYFATRLIMIDWLGFNDSVSTNRLYCASEIYVAIKKVKLMRKLAMVRVGNTYSMNHYNK